MSRIPSRTYANPRRLPRRNHYQEGPDFLFLATQGGRPPDKSDRRSAAAIVRRRRAALRRWADGESLGAVAAEFGCSRASLFRWRIRYAQGGLVGLVDGPRVGRASDLPPVIERLILTVRLLTYWNSRRIAAEFRRRGVWPLGHGQVDRILDRSGSHRPSYVRTPGPRYERAAVNELWHIDLKGPFYLLGATGRARTCHFVALVDDHSRFLLGIRAVPTKEAVWILALLEHMRRNESALAVERLTAAEAAYVGDLFEEDVYADWAVMPREAARALYNRVGRALADLSANEGDSDGSAAYLRRVVARDAYDEPSHLALVTALARGRRHGEARRAYQAYVGRMAEIEVEPAPYPASA